MRATHSRQDKTHLSLISSAKSRLTAILMVCAFISMSACVTPLPEDPALNSFLDDVSGPPEPMPFDDLMKEKADVIVLPSISVMVWAVGAIVVYIGAQTVYSNTIDDFEILLSEAFGQPTDWSWAESTGEPADQAAHLTESLKRVVYRSEESDFYSVTGNDYLRFLNTTTFASRVCSSTAQVTVAFCTVGRPTTVAASLPTSRTSSIFSSAPTWTSSFSATI